MFDTVLNIIIDTREQTPWSFPQHIAYSERGTLKTGDYALKGDELNFAIERKSLNDFIGTITSGWDRFQRELTRMEESNFIQKIIVVEADFQDYAYTIIDDRLLDPKYRSGAKPQFVFSRIAELTMRGCHVIFAGALGSAVAVALFKKRQLQIIGGK